jgi:RES domain-containing protein/HEPN superfamily RES-like protein
MPAKISQSPRCCPKCFNDGILEKHIQKGGKKGYCDFCQKNRAVTCPAEDLASLFLPLIQRYEITTHGEHYNQHMEEASDHGEYLHQAIYDDWGVFSDDVFAAGKAEELLAAILEPLKLEDLDLGSLYTARDEAYAARTPKDQWWEFEHHIKHERRFLIDPNASALIVDPRSLLHADVLSRLVREIPLSTILYRARLGSDEDASSPKPKPRPKKEMGAPPYHLITRGGRANPPGIRVLYAAQLDTAVAEIRPWVGAYVTVAEGALAKPLRLIDFSDPGRLSTSSPFGHVDLDADLELAATLRVVGQKMAEPLGPDRVEIDYVPTQYLAEVIQAAGYDGMLYGSALAEGGRNVVVFDPDTVRVTATYLVRVSQVRYTSVRE